MSKRKGRTATTAVDEMNALLGKQSASETDAVLEEVDQVDEGCLPETVEAPRVTVEDTAKTIAATFGTGVPVIPPVESKEDYPGAKKVRAAIKTFTDYVTAIKHSTPELRRLATGHLIHVFNVSLRVDEAGGYQDVLNMFNEYEPYVDPGVALQGISTYPQATVKKAGSYFAMMFALARHLKSRGKTPFNIDVKGISVIFESTTLSNFLTLKTTK